MFLLGREDCLSCAQYPVEAKIIEQETGLRSVFVGSGPDTLFFDRFFRRHRLDFRIDPSASLISAFNEAESAVVVLIGSNGRVLWIASRTSDLDRMPVSQVLKQLVSDIDSTIPRPLTEALQ